MAPKLKVFRTHLGFYDMIVAAPSQKAALEAWGASPHLFSKGFAAVETAPRLVTAALKKPGVVLRRQFGSKGDFQESAVALRAPKASPTDAVAHREREQKGAAAERIKRRATKERAREEATTAREPREEQRPAEQRRERAAAEQHTATAYAKKYAAHRRNEAKAKAEARQALQTKLRSTLQERKETLRDIKRQEDVLAKTRRELEQAFEMRIVAIQRELRKA
jgi:colicin import membrane protein